MDLTEILICLEWSKKEAKLSNEKLEQVFESVVAYGYRAWCKIFQQQQSLSRTREGKLCRFSKITNRQPDCLSDTTTSDRGDPQSTQSKEVANAEIYNFACILPWLVISD